jgi:hypothetical protein
MKYTYKKEEVIRSLKQPVDHPLKIKAIRIGRRSSIITEDLLTMSNFYMKRFMKINYIF